MNEPNHGATVPLPGPEALDAEYDARAAIPEHPAIFARWRAASDEARRTLRHEPECYYGPSPRERLDLFHAARPGGPLLVFIHGGYWRALDKHDFSFLAPPFTAAGTALAVLNYGLLPTTPLAQIVGQIRRALAWLWRNADGLGYNRWRIAVCGHSAGGHLAAMMLATDWAGVGRDLPADLVRGALAISGLHDLEPLTRAPFLRDDLDLDATAARTLSPVHQPCPRAAPLCTAVGELESAEFHRQSQLIARAWPHCFAGGLSLPQRNHLTVLDALGEQDSLLFALALRLLGRDGHASGRRAAQGAA
ncbi:MAG: alpha/beta hydrolase [Betaproteobacteria bacterium]|nr:alpha/beta hydrolase [Betaproteobacteria bacterium]